MGEQLAIGDVQHIQDDLLAMAGIVEGMLLESVDLLQRSDLAGLERLGEEERQISAKRLAIEMGCLKIIASQRPKGVALRSAVAMVEIASELERIAYHAKQVARANCLMLEHHLRKPLGSIHHLAAEVQVMLDRALEAFSQQDVSAARRVCDDAQAADALYRQVYQELLVVMNSRPRAANQAIYLSRAAYHLKRASDRVTGICEWVVFIVLGTMDAMVKLPPDPWRRASASDSIQTKSISL
ncbi:MAG: PhoU domain-containing protein [Anaerolineae bacterium]|jgi:phosphate transport system protein